MKLKKIETPKEIKQALMTPFPNEVVLTKPGSKNKYISQETVTDKLNATFGFLGWSWDIQEKWIENSTPKIIKTRYNQATGRNDKLPKEEWYEEEQKPTAHIIGKLTVNFEREDGSIYSVSKSAPGSQPIVGGQETQENAFKSANSDALKKAATMFGIALELYRKGKEQDYFNAINYENPWTNEEKEKHKDNFNYINSFMKKYNVAFEGINQMVGICFNGYFNNLNAITPEYLNQFVNYLKNVEEKSKKPSNILDE